MSPIRTLSMLSAAGLALLLGGVAAQAAEAVAASALNVRSGPGPSYRIVDTLRPGQVVDVQRCQGTWCFVEKSGPDGWVSANYLGPAYAEDDDYDDDDYYDDYDDRDYIYIRPGRPFYQPYRPYRPFGEACIGGRNASFCISN